ncbi:STAS domain-containing protein [Silvibacterium dinghuense]|uniref:Anti-sigma factor antagonist n=1 Tax=Silvibacterium dinghuense TaxID=1560006 RepID=A0A4Q1SIR7_9BACT|nr:STAS domain-containing protein [Silvibacterium dinghuense]RXS97130.1 anti-sigma factor antagonist [Silvibacterium dinghuense]GGG96480.1 putative anti-sigma factor antagonist [Silvibacterium dinghuense]
MEQETLDLEVLAGSRDGIRILRLTGPLTLHTIFPLQEELRREHRPLTVFDLSGVPYMDSAGMGVIINTYISAQRRGFRVAAAGLNYRVIELFKLTHVDTLIPVCETVAQAEAL